MSEQDYVDTIDNNDNNSNDNHNDDEYEKVCFVCHRPESVAGKMIDLPNNICVCATDCMQKSFDANEQYELRRCDGLQPAHEHAGSPDAGILDDMDASRSRSSQRVKKKKPEDEEATDRC